MQFFLDDSGTPIRLVPAGAPRPNRRFDAPPSPPIPASRAVPGYPYIRLTTDDDLSDNYPFDAFQDLRSAFASPPLRTMQSRMDYVQQQRARAHLQRQLLERQMHEQEQRERELREYQYRLEMERRRRAKIAAQQARQAYLDRLKDEEKQRQLEQQRKAELAERKRQGGDAEGAFYPPFHFFDHILDSQMKSRDDLERRRAQKSALADLLNTYFGVERSNDDQESVVAQAKSVSQSPDPQTKQPTEESPKEVVNEEEEEQAAIEQPFSFHKPAETTDPAMLDNVLRVVHDRLGEIAADDDKQTADDIKVDVVDEPKAAKSGDADVQVEEPVDYKKLAANLRHRVNNLDDDDIFVPISPLLGFSDNLSEADESANEDNKSKSAEKKQPKEKAPEAIKPKKRQNPEHMQVDEDAASDMEFSRMLDNCKRQLSDLQEVAAKPNCEAARRRRRRRRRHHHKAHEPAATRPEQVSEPVVESEEDRQRRAVHTIEDYILGERSKKHAQEIVSSLRTLRDIEKEVDKTRTDYNRRLHNTQLSFVAEKDGSLKLAHNKTNFVFHEYQEVLERQLLKLDEVPSFGDETVRHRRKAVVRKIQAILDALDQFALDQESELSEASGMADVSSNSDF